MTASKGAAEDRSPLPVVLSVVVPCRNGLPHLVELLDSLAAEHTSFDWEVVVVENGSTDGSLRAAQTYTHLSNLTVVEATEKRGPAYARNAGVSTAVGRYICFIDDDDVVAPGYLTRMKQSLDRDGFVGAVMDGVHLNTAWAVAAMRAVPAAGLDSGPWPWHSAGMLGVRRDLFDRVGGFDESFNTGDDADFCWRLQRDTGTVLKLSDAVVWHRWRDSPAAMFRQGRWHGMANPHLFARWSADGMRRPGPKRVVKRWMSCAIHLLRGTYSKEHRGRALFLLGLSIGHIEGSFRYRVLYL